MDLAAINVKKPREAQIWKCSTGNPALRILPDSNNLTTKLSHPKQQSVNGLVPSI